MKDIVIDGSKGEGGGQILRSALSLSLVTGRPFAIEKIRAGREKPGLKRQHLTCVNAAAALGGATVDGAGLGSTALRFVPGPVTHGDRTFSIGTAGSTMLVLQTVLPPLLVAAGRSRVVLEGGTHNRMAPPFEFIARAFLPVLKRLGAVVELTLEQPGFYPAGGGRVVVDIVGGRPLAPLTLIERGALTSTKVEALISQLSPAIAHTVFAAVGRGLGLPASELAVVEIRSPGPGNAVIVTLQAEHATEVVSAIGEKGVPSEKVAKAVVDEASTWLASGVPVGPHLCDQLLLPLALFSGGRFKTSALTPHSTTNMDVLRQFLDVGIEVSASTVGRTLVDVTPR